MNSYPDWAIKNKVGYSAVLGDAEGRVAIVTHDGRKLTHPMTEEEARGILAGESDGFGKWIMSEDLLEKQVKINGSFPQKTGVVVGSYPAGWNQPEEEFIINILSTLGGKEHLTRSEFNLLQGKISCNEIAMKNH